MKLVPKLELKIALDDKGITVSGIPPNLDVAMQLLADAMKIVAKYFVQELLKQDKVPKGEVAPEKKLMGARSLEIVH